MVDFFDEEEVLFLIDKYSITYPKMAEIFGQENLQIFEFGAFGIPFFTGIGTQIYNFFHILSVNTMKNRRK